MNRYDDLAERWRQQDTRIGELHETLRTESYLLLTELAKNLGVEGRTWKELKNPFHRKYVEYRLSPFPDREDETRTDRYTPSGELEFGIVITFDHGEASFPKSRFLIPLATRMFKRHPQYCLWDPVASLPRQGRGWVATKPAMIQEIVSLIEEELAFDPFEGPPPAQRIRLL